MGRRQIGAALAALGLAGLIYAATWMHTAPAVPAAAERIVREVTLQALGGTAIQMDACTTAQAARISAGRLLERGSAGYVHYDGEYRVLGALAGSRAEAEAICARLTAEGLPAECCDCGGSALTLRVSGQPGHIDALAAAIHAVDMAAVQPGQIAMQLDGERIDQDRARGLIAMLVSDLETAQAEFRETDAEGALSGQLDSLMTDALTHLEPLTQNKGEDRLVFSGEMRCAGMAILFERENMIRRMAQQAGT